MNLRSSRNLSANPSAAIKGRGLFRVRQRRARLVGSAAALLLFGCASVIVYRVASVELPFQGGRLGNGLRIVAQPMSETAHLFIGMRFEAGAARDPQGKAGLAWVAALVAERLAEGGSTAVVRSLPFAPHDRGVAVELDSTFHWWVVRPSQLTPVLDLLAGQLRGPTTPLDTELVAVAKAQVCNERWRRLDSQPAVRHQVELARHLFPRGHPYHRGLLGGEDAELWTITAAEVAGFLAQHYRPANATLVVAGPGDPRQRLAEIAQRLGPLSAGVAIALPEPRQFPNSGRETVLDPDLRATRISVAWPAGPALSEEALALELLTDNASGLFHARLVEREGLAHAAGSELFPGMIGSMYAAHAVTAEVEDVELLEEKMLDLAETLSASRQPRELDESRRRLVYGRLLEFDQPSRRVARMAADFVRLGHPLALNTELARIDGLAWRSVIGVGRDRLAEKNAFVLVHQPGTRSDTATACPAAGDDRPLATALWPTQSESVAAHAVWTEQQVRRWLTHEPLTLANGLRARVIRRGDLPITELFFNIEGGASRERAERRGTARLWLELLGHAGEGSREAFFHIGARTWYEIGPERSTVRVEVISAYADDALRLVAELLTGGAVTQKQLVAARQSAVLELDEAATDTTFLARRALHRARGMAILSPIPSRGTLAAVSLADLSAYQDENVKAPNIDLVVVSDRPTLELRAAVEKQFGGVPSGSVEESSAGTSLPAARGDILLVDAPRARQTTVLIGFDRPGWADWRAELQAAAVAVLLEQQLERLQATTGATFEVRRGLWGLREDDTLMVQVADRRDETDRLMNGVLTLLDELRGRGLDERDAAHVSHTLLDELASLGASGAELAGEHALWMHRGRTEDEVLAAVDWAAAISPAQLEELVRDRLGAPATLVVAGARPRLPRARSGVLGHFGGQIVALSFAELVD